MLPSINQDFISKYQSILYSFSLEFHINRGQENKKKKIKKSERKWISTKKDWIKMRLFYFMHTRLCLWLSSLKLKCPKIMEFMLDVYTCMFYVLILKEFLNWKSYMPIVWILRNACHVGSLEIIAIFCPIKFASR